MQSKRPSERFLHNAWTCTFLKGVPGLLYHEAMLRVYPDGTTLRSKPKAIYGPSTPPLVTPFGKTITGYPLYRYQFANGNPYYEFLDKVVQNSAGKTLYLLALNTHDGKQIIDSMWGVPELYRRSFILMESSLK